MPVVLPVLSRRIQLMVRLTDIDSSRNRRRRNASQKFSPSAKVKHAVRVRCTSAVDRAFAAQRNVGNAADFVGNPYIPSDRYTSPKDHSSRSQHRSSLRADTQVDQIAGLFDTQRRCPA